MCSKTVNRQNILRAVRKGGITGATMFQCATNVVACLGLHPSQHRQVLEILLQLQNDFRVRLHGLELKGISDQERQALLRQKKDDELRRSRIRRRTAAHRSRGIRGLTPLELIPPEDPEWDPEVPATDEIDFAEWAAQFGIPTSPAGGWEGCDSQAALGAMQELWARQFHALCVAQVHEASTSPTPYGLVEDLVTAGVDADNIFTDPNADQFGEGRVAVIY